MAVSNKLVDNSDSGCFLTSNECSNCSRRVSSKQCPILCHNRNALELKICRRMSSNWFPSKCKTRDPPNVLGLTGVYEHRYTRRRPINAELSIDNVQGKHSLSNSHGHCLHRFRSQPIVINKTTAMRELLFALLQNNNVPNVKS